MGASDRGCALDSFFHKGVTMQRKKKATARPWAGLVFVGAATVWAYGATREAAAAAAAKESARTFVRGRARRVTVAWNVNLYELGEWRDWNRDAWDGAVTVTRADGSEFVAPLDSVAVVNA